MQRSRRVDLAIDDVQPPDAGPQAVGVIEEVAPLDEFDVRQPGRELAQERDVVIVGSVVDDDDSPDEVAGRLLTHGE